MLLQCYTGTPGREPNFEDKARNFQAHATKLADTANMVATAGGCRNKKTVEEIFKSSKLVSKIFCIIQIEFDVSDVSAFEYKYFLYSSKVLSCLA